MAKVDSEDPNAESSEKAATAKKIKPVTFQWRGGPNQMLLHSGLGFPGERTILWRQDDDRRPATYTTEDEAEIVALRKRGELFNGDVTEVK